MLVLNPFVGYRPVQPGYGATGWKSPTISAPPIELVEIERLRYRCGPYPLPGSSPLAKVITGPSRRLVPAVTLHYLQNLL
ncbi:hypothetical protein ACNKHW_03475 [Shigella flexneri]